MKTLFGLISFLIVAAPIAGAAIPAAEELRLLISIEQPEITSTSPARVTLHFHNASQQPLWLYRPASAEAKECSSLDVRLEPLEAKAVRTPAAGRVMESAGLPRPKLVRLAAEDDSTDKVSLQLRPARAGEQGQGEPLWGRYRLSVVYRAQYSNADEIRRNTGAVLWQGETTSNCIEIELKQPAGEGSVSGSVLNASGQTLSDVLASLSDQDERLIDQTRTDTGGRYSFNPLPLGTYWVTVRRPTFTEDTVVFRHTTLTPAAPSGTIDFVLHPPDIYEARHLLHKPVIILVTDEQGRPLGNVRYEIAWSSGKILENVNGVTGEDGTATCELISGRSFVTLKRRGCARQDSRMDVAPGPGVDAFKLGFDCGAK
ncbi:MAG: carboxypeptidase-like regulatory domain-containing protein [Terriglobia bacterium]|jgi:hypothetical protein